MTTEQLGVYRVRRSTTRLIVHTSDQFIAMPSVTPLLRTKGRAMGLLDVGYHYVIEKDGRLNQTRHVFCIGAHTPGCNHDSIGVYTLPTAAAHETLSSLFHLLHTHGANVALVTRQEALKRKRLPEGDDLRFLIPGAQYKIMTDQTYTPQTHGPRLSAQQQALVDYLMSGRTCTNLIAITNLGIGSLSSRVAELMKIGYPIQKEDAEDIHGRSYKKYSMDPEVARAALNPQPDLLLTPARADNWDPA